MLNSNGAEEKCGKIRVVNGSIEVSNPNDGAEPAKIRYDEKCKIFIDGIQIFEDTNVFAENEIKIDFNCNNSERKMKITNSSDNMKAYLSIEYTPEIVYVLEDCEECNILSIKPKELEKNYNSMYKYEDILEELHKNKIMCGIIENNIKKCINEYSADNMLVAEGANPIDGKDDYIDFKFSIDTEIKSLKEDTKGRVDFKSIGSIESVKKGEIIAIKVLGQEGKNGFDLYGKELKCKPVKKLNIKVGQGCILKDDNTVVAAIDGRPFFKSSTFYIYQVYNVPGDVDISTGNVNFIGDICIKGYVREGMKVSAGGSIEINNGVERATITAKGNVTIKGNVITSQISGGGEDVSILNQIQDYNKLVENIKILIDTIEEVKKFNLLGYDSSDGQIIKVLIENKFKEIPRCCMSIIKNSILRMEKDKEDLEIVTFVKEKLTGLGPLAIKSYGEVYDFMKVLENRVDALRINLSLPVDVKLAYCQESKIVSSGNIVISGKGTYGSDLCAEDSLFFINKQSVCRGGILKASQEIRCATIGSQSGVVTKLMVREKGHIYADVVYENTQFMIGTREYKIDEASKSVHAYLNENLDIVVDKFKL